MAEFTLTGRIRGSTSVVAWSDEGGFADESGETDFLIRSGAWVCATVTGPCFAAADRPATVALLTAYNCFDDDRDVTEEGAEEVRAELERETALPEWATP